jgi:zinc protease
MTASDFPSLRFERRMRSDGLTIVRQAAPAGSAGFAATYVGPSGWAYDPRGAEGLAVVASMTALSAAGRSDRVALARALDRLGGSIQRHCAPESNEVTVTGPASELEPLLRLFSGVVRAPRFESDDLERVRRQVLERQLREGSQPGHRAERELLETILPAGHPYRPSGLGTARSVRRLRRADLVRFHRDQTASEGGFFVVTTHRSMEAVEALARRHLPALPTARPARHRTEAPTPSPKTSSRAIAMPGRTQTEIRIGGIAPPRSDPVYPALALANEVLGGRTLLNRLFQNVREARGLAYHASSDLEAMRWSGYWVAQAGTGPERADQVLKLVTAEVRRIADDAIPSVELDRIRESAIGEIPLGLETAADAHELAVDGAYHGLAEDHWVTWPGVLRALRPDAIRDAARATFDLAHAVTVVAGPGAGTRSSRAAV